MRRVVLGRGRTQMPVRRFPLLLLRGPFGLCRWGGVNVRVRSALGFWDDRSWRGRVWGPGPQGGRRDLPFPLEAPKRPVAFFFIPFTQDGTRKPSWEDPVHSAPTSYVCCGITHTGRRHRGHPECGVVQGGRRDGRGSPDPRASGPACSPGRGPWPS